MTNKPYRRITFFVSETFPSYAGGGRNAFQFARFLTQKNFCATICCLNYNNKLPDREVIHKVQINRIGYFNKSIIHKIASVPSLVFNYYRQIKHTDIVYIYGSYLPLLSMIIIFGKLGGRKIIFRSTLLGDDDFKSIREKSFFWPVQKSIFHQISLYHATNKAFQTRFRQSVKKDIPILIHSQGVNYSDYQLPGYSKKGNNPYVILSVGFLIKRKGYLQVFNALRSVTFPFKYIIVGQFEPDRYHRSSSTEIHDMQEIFARGKSILGDKIEFAGTTENLTDYFSKADLFLHSAISEGVPNVVLEAMAFGLPVLLNGNCHFAHELFSDKEADKFFSDRELTKKIHYHYKHREFSSKIASEGKKAIEKNHTFEHLYQDFISYL